MAFIWVQQWFALPTISYPAQMGDLPPGSRPQASDVIATGLAHDENSTFYGSSTYKSPDSNAPFYSQLSSIPQGPPRQDFRSSVHTSVQYQPQDNRVSPLNMGSMAGALPDFGSSDESLASSQGIPRTLSGASPSAIAYQLGQNLQMPTHMSGNFPVHQPYPSSYAAGPYQQGFVHTQGSQQGAYPPFAANQQRLSGPNSMQPPYQHYQQPSQFMYYPAPFGHQSHYVPGYQMHGAQNQAIYGRRGSSTSASFAMPGQNIEPSQYEGIYSDPRMGPGSVQNMGMTGPAYGAPQVQSSSLPRSGPVSSIPRGPPRKPKQSGHALWVGNLPPGTTVIALKDHFSREATKDIESLFLISKSNCAFVNYRTEASCTAAMHRFHDSRFNGVRLVCRLRRSSTPASGVPTGPSAMMGSQHSNLSSPSTTRPDGEPVDSPQNVDPESPTLNNNNGVNGTGASQSSNKYFIVKSLTLQDLELSVRNGIWATQSHNEDILNKAFESAENVYLVFSANKSGEYFGYARMASSILEDGSCIIGSVPKPESVEEAPDAPKSIPTPAMEWAPRGRIIDDSARGTIFWEAENSESEGDDETVVREDTPVDDASSSAVTQSWGKPFKVKWVSTNRLPFYRTRGLRNPWNANREVKIARDGTELEPSVGERLVQMFHRLGPSSAAAPMIPLPPQMRPY
ncbi:hypothetical protein P153DRAFT_381466 [Dothidotthia symphoricarpi CBS 119687]|uniref:YTH domain-containing protein n=1 Tax=Dothidotthia symphoricarpi CBS 119687 TaxID=1392245 RepID=A0A6A6ARW7_9PLEO|nr:uncharacterized protein P153DRAFT_381466 [Dothidotthia symphoricarpi CBS 119687]KAF2134286.1 hypothetical protein P153DRAFT_381466 [Dothidotthia symphoricarpi CBS 119687]